MAVNLSTTFLPRTFSPPPLPVGKGRSVGNSRPPAAVTCRKKDLHPEFHDDAKVYCNGELVMTTGGTQKEYVVDVWSGNHPFYLGNRSALLLDADQVEKFKKKFAGLSEIMEIPILKGETPVLTKRKSKAKKK